MNLDQTLSTVLNALRNEIEPALQSDRARASLQSVVHVLTHLAVNNSAPQPACRDDAARVTLLIGDSDDAECTTAAQPDAAGHDDPSIPWAYFGDESLYARLEAALATTMTAGDAAARATIRGLIEWEKRALDRVADRTRQLLPARAPARDDASGAGAIEARRAALESYLRARYATCPELRVTELRPFAGGRSKFTGLVQIAGCAELPATLVLRQDAAINTTGGPSVSGEFALLQRLHEFRLKVARPYLLERSSSPLGTPFVLMERLRGSIASGLLAPPYSANVARMLARALAELHAIAPSRLSGAIPNPIAPSRDELSAELDGFATTWFTLDRPPSVAIRYAVGWLREHIELGVEGNAALIHRDPLFHNVLAEGDELTGIVDWEFARMGYPAEDLGWIRSAVEGALPWAEFIDAYEAGGGPRLSTAQLDFYAVWAAVRLGSMMVHSNWLASTGVLHDVEYTCVAFHETYIARQWLSTHVARILERLT